MKVITQANTVETAAKAAASPRKRAHFVVHQPEDRAQRILQVANKGTYYPPHQHSGKLEYLTPVAGRLAVITFDDEGKIDDVEIIERGHNEYVQIVPGTWHSVVVLDDSATFMEFIDGYYAPMTHKEFAEWAPKEGEPGVDKYLEEMTADMQAYLAAHPTK